MTEKGTGPGEGARGAGGGGGQGGPGFMWQGGLNKDSAAHHMDGHTQKACHAQPDIRQSGKRIGDDCTVERCKD